MYQVGYVKGEAEPYILFENPTPQKKRLGFCEKNVSPILSCEKLVQKGLELAKS